MYNIYIYISRLRSAGYKTVDGRNPANQLTRRIYHDSQGFLYMSGGAEALPSTVYPIYKQVK